jgi:hypothetical protein
MRQARRRRERLQATAGDRMAIIRGMASLRAGAVLTAGRELDGQVGSEQFRLH